MGKKHCNSSCSSFSDSECEYHKCKYKTPSKECKKKIEHKKCDKNKPQKTICKSGNSTDSDESTNASSISKSTKSSVPLSNIEHNTKDCIKDICKHSKIVVITIH